MAERGVIVRRLTSIEDIGEINVLCTDKTGTLTSAVVRIEAALDAHGRESGKVRDYAYLNASMQTGFPNPVDDALRAEGPRSAESEFSKIDEVPYDFVRKRLSILAQRGTDRIMITKGALRAVLDVCTRAESSPGVLLPLEDLRADILKRFEALSARGYRCLGVAWRTVTEGKSTKAVRRRWCFSDYSPFSTLRSRVPRKVCCA
jgi:Mg2+-importing ATPase